MYISLFGCNHLSSAQVFLNSLSLWVGIFWNSKEEWNPIQFTNFSFGESVFLSGCVRNVTQNAVEKAWWAAFTIHCVTCCDMKFIQLITNDWVIWSIKKKKKKQQQKQQPPQSKPPPSSSSANTVDVYSCTTKNVSHIFISKYLYVDEQIIYDPAKLDSVTYLYRKTKQKKKKQEKFPFKATFHGICLQIDFDELKHIKMEGQKLKNFLSKLQ